MGLLDSVLGGVLGSMQGGGQGGALGGVLGGVPGGALGGGGNADLLKAVVGMLGNDAAGGGLGGLVAKFQQSGLGDVVQSWISSGQNMPVSADQLSNVLGNDTIGGLAKRLGLNPGDVAGQLSQMLPQVVDHLTPSGQMPAGGLGSVGDLLGQLFKR